MTHAVTLRRVKSKVVSSTSKEFLTAFHIVATI